MDLITHIVSNLSFIKANGADTITLGPLNPLKFLEIIHNSLTKHFKGQTSHQYIRRRNSHPAVARARIPMTAMGQYWVHSRSKEAPSRKTERTIMRK